MHCKRCGYQTGDYSINTTCAICGVSISNSEGELIQGISMKFPGRRTAPNSGRRSSGFPTLAEPIGWVFQTLWCSMTRTESFFAQLRTHAIPREALLYGLVLGSIGTVLTILADSFLPPTYVSFLSRNVHYSKSSGLTPAILVLTPLILIFQFLAFAGYTQLMLLISKSRKKPLSYTFCIMGYAGGAAIFQWIPFIGPFAAIIAWLYLALSGLHFVHGISRGRAFIVLILPLILLLAFAFFLVIIAAVVGVLAGASHPDLLHFFRN